MAIIIIVVATAFSAGCIDPTKAQEERYVIDYEIVDDDIVDLTPITTIYEFSYDNKNWIIEATVPKDRYNAYTNEKYLLVKKQNPSIHDSYFYKNEPEEQRAFIKDEYVQNVVNQFKTQNGDLTDKQLINVITYFVQTQIEYYDDELQYGRDYIAYPMQVLINAKGDCDCKAVLLSGLLNHAGYHSVTVYINAGDVGHIFASVEASLLDLPNGAITVTDGQKDYYVIEATSQWTIGNLEGQYIESLNQFHEINDKIYMSKYVNREQYYLYDVLTGKVLLNKYEND